MVDPIELRVIPDPATVSVACLDSREPGVVQPVTSNLKGGFDVRPQLVRTFARRAPGGPLRVGRRGEQDLMKKPYTVPQRVWRNLPAGRMRLEASPT